MDFKRYLSKLSRTQQELLEAIKSCTANQVQALVCKYWESTKPGEVFNYLLLVTALERGCESTIEFFIKENCPVKLTQKTGIYYTPLYYAIKLRNPDIFKALWDRGASVFDKDANDDSALEFAMIQNEYLVIDPIFHGIKPRKTTKTLDPNNEDDVALFHASCWFGRSESVQAFLDRGFSLDSRSGFLKNEWKGFTPLHFAFDSPQSVTQLAKKLPGYDGVDLLAEGEDGRTVVHLAFRRNVNLFQRHDFTMERMKLFSETQALNPKDKNGLSLFHIVCAMGSSVRANFIKQYIDGKVDVNSNVSLEDGDFPGFTALHFAAKEPSLDIIRLLLENGADPTKAEKNGLTPLHLVLQSTRITLECQLKIVEMLLHHGANPVAKDLEGRTPLHVSFCSHALSYQLDESERLLLSRNQGINHTDEHGLSYLHMACTSDDIDAVKTLVKSGTSINARIPAQPTRYIGFSSLHLAVKFNQVEIVEHLLINGADPNCLNDSKDTPLHLACDRIQGHKFERIRCSRNQYHEKDCDCDDWTPRITLHSRMIELLIKHGAVVDAEDMQGSTPLMRNLGAPEEVRRLSSQNPDYYQKQDRSALNDFFDRQKIVMDILLRNGANIDFQDGSQGSILHILTKRGGRYYLNVNLIEIALKEGANVNAVNAVDGLTPLQLAVKGIVNRDECSNDRDTSLIDLLLKYGADVNVKDENFDTPLHIAAKRDPYYSPNKAILSKLLDHPDIDIEARNSWGGTPLFVAMHERNHSFIIELLDSEAEIDLQDNDGQWMLQNFLENMVFDRGVEVSARESKVLRHIVFHMKKLMALKRRVSKETNEYFIKCLVHLSERELTSMDSEIQKELEDLKSQKIDNYTSLYDILFKDSIAMTKHVLNDNLHKAVKSLQSWPRTLIFGNFIKNRCNEGRKRSELLQPAKRALHLQCNVNLPDSCSEQILSYLSNENLRSLMKSSFVEKRREISAKVSPSTQKYQANLQKFLQRARL